MATDLPEVLPQPGFFPDSDDLFKRFMRLFVPLPIYLGSGWFQPELLLVARSWGGGGYNLYSSG